MAKDRSGMIFEREKGVWYARVTFTDPSGKRRYMKRRADNKTHAREFVRQLLRDLDDSGDTVIEGNTISLNRYFDKWLETAAKPRLSERT